MEKDKSRVVGRPRKYQTREDLINAINTYFKDTPFIEYSVTGLSLVLGSKQLIQDYDKKKEFGDIIKEAKLIIENSYEMSLRDKGGAHNIFALKNFGWSDKQEIEHSGSIEGFLDQARKKASDRGK